MSIGGTVAGPPQGYPYLGATITDAAGWKATTDLFTWTISYPPLLAPTPVDQVSTINTAIVALQLTASGGSGFYTWSGTLPAGLTMTVGGRITGTPTALSSGPVTLTVTDNDTVNGGSLAITFNWTIVAKPTVTPANQISTLDAVVNDTPPRRARTRRAPSP